MENSDYYQYKYYKYKSRYHNLRSNLSGGTIPTFYIYTTGFAFRDPTAIQVFQDFLENLPDSLNDHIVIIRHYDRDFSKPETEAIKQTLEEVAKRILTAKKLKGGTLFMAEYFNHTTSETIPSFVLDGANIYSYYCHHRRLETVIDPTFSHTMDKKGARQVVNLKSVYLPLWVFVPLDGFKLFQYNPETKVVTTYIEQMCRFGLFDQYLNRGKRLAPADLYGLFNIEILRDSLSLSELSDAIWSTDPVEEIDQLSALARDEEAAKWQQEERYARQKSEKFQLPPGWDPKTSPTTELCLMCKAFAGSKAGFCSKCYPEALKKHGET